MDVMELRRRLMAQMAQNAWRYEKHTTIVSQYESYDTYYDFADVYVTPYIGDATTYEVIVNVYNNTSNTRAAKYHFEYVNQDAKIVTIGARVGGNFFHENYGANFYAGATIEVFISKDVPIITT